MIALELAAGLAIGLFLIRFEALAFQVFKL